MNNKETKKRKTSDEYQVKTFKREEIQKFFPAIYNEVSSDATKGYVSSDKLKELITEEQGSENQVKQVSTQKLKEKDHLKGFDPQAKDFIRRAKTKQEALEIIEFLEQKKEISEREADSFRNQLKDKGLESFGKYKDHGYYFEYQRKKHLEEKMKLQSKRIKS